MDPSIVSGDMRRRHLDCHGFERTKSTAILITNSLGKALLKGALQPHNPADASRKAINI
jgi:hypothetical protein